MKKVLGLAAKEAKALNHSYVGAGSAEGAMDASNIIKPSLSRGELQCVGATTLNEYRKYIEKDAALERRFQQVKINKQKTEVIKDQDFEKAASLRDEEKKSKERLEANLEKWRQESEENIVTVNEEDIMGVVSK